MVADACDRDLRECVRILIELLLTPRAAQLGIEPVDTDEIVATVRARGRRDDAAHAWLERRAPYAVRAAHAHRLIRARTARDHARQVQAGLCPQSQIAITEHPLRAERD